MAKHRATPRGKRPIAPKVPAAEHQRPALRVSRQEILWLLAILAAGVALRWAFPSRLAVEHFDEGVYASNIWFGAEDSYEYPLTCLYAPPLLPALIESAVAVQQIVRPTSDAPLPLAVMLPSLLAGSLTPLALWWLARRWFAPAVAIGAATLAASSDFHVLYSRAALTDCLLGLLLVVAVGWIEKAVFRGGSRAILMAGALTAAAWWTKYNGWLPLAIGAAGTGLLCLLDTRMRGSALVMAARGGAVASIALLAWLPVLISLEPFGGYQAVAENHARYVAGLAGWPAGAARQHANLQYLDGMVTVAGLALAFGLVAGVRACPRRDLSRLAVVTGMVVIAALAVWCGSHLVLLVLGGFGLLSRAWGGTERGTGPQLSGLCYLTVWFVALLAVTPLYHPYPRLVLPWLCSAWLAAALGMEGLLGLFESGVANGEGRPTGARNHGSKAWHIAISFLGINNSPQAQSRARFAGQVAAGLLIAAATAGLALRTRDLFHRGVPGWSDRTGLQKVATSIQKQATAAASRGQSLYCVYGEPSLFFHLRAQGVEQVIAIGEVPRAEDLTDPVPLRLILIVGPHARRSSDFQAKWTQSQNGFRPLSVHTYRPSDLVLLDNYDPRQFDKSRPPIEEQVTVYAVRR